ncbi:MAG: NADH-quinone oxidoreductase subunit J [Bacteroidia bacterium]|nr:NADH-quinone oxidoreductase subunit J [Bacteroidia bacterium]
MTHYFFYFLSFLAVFFAALVVRSKNPVHSVLYLVMTFFAIAGHYVLLNAQFLAAVHIIVYAGAIMVLFLYVLMMMNLNKDSEPGKSWMVQIAAVLASGLLLLVITASVKGADSLPVKSNVSTSIGLLENLGKTLFNEFMLPFEVSSILFLIAMVGAVMLGKKEETVNS